MCHLKKSIFPLKVLNVLITYNIHRYYPKSHITLFRSKTMFFGIDSILHNIPSFILNVENILHNIASSAKHCLDSG